MRHSLYDRSARKQTVSLTINSDLYAKIKEAGINASQVAEAALAEALKERIREDIKQDVAAMEAFVAEHGNPAEIARAYFAKQDGDLDDAV